MEMDFAIPSPISNARYKNIEYYILYVHRWQAISCARWSLQAMWKVLMEEEMVASQWNEI